MDRYRTLKGRSEGTYREKASKFIGIALPVANEEAFNTELERIAKEHHAARHHCFALMLGEDRSLRRSNDAGEPAGTGGAPILRAIVSADITFAAVVVVRYFGGTLLGKGGLVHAYGTAARLALAQATIIEHLVLTGIAFRCSLTLFELVKKDVARCGGEVTDRTFGDDCSGSAWVPRSERAAMVDRWRTMGIDAHATDQLK